MKIVLEINAGILTGEYKRALETFIGEECFEQRKNYDEYYCNFKEQVVDMTLEDLMKIGRLMIVRVYGNGAVISPP